VIMSNLAARLRRSRGKCRSDGTLAEEGTVGDWAQDDGECSSLAHRGWRQTRVPRFCRL